MIWRADRLVRVTAPLAVLLLAACSASTVGGANGEANDGANGGVEPASQPRLGLMSTLPIYWNEAAVFSDLLAQGGAVNWVREAFERHYALEPLDVLTPDTLAGLDRLVLAQPRALSAAENVALDDWVRGGGRLLLFADPMLTHHSRYALGDPRRPHDVALLSPILARWGLELTFDPEQPGGERLVAVAGTSLPVELTGAFQSREGAGETAGDCALSAENILARCTIGQGHAILVADAALLDGEAHGDEAHGTDRDMRHAVLDRLLAAGFAD